LGVNERAVVGPDLSVHGAEGIRVCDASAMPSVISANTNSTVVRIAEKAADLGTSSVEVQLSA
jgi:choline dehydrogenase